MALAKGLSRDTVPDARAPSTSVPGSTDQDGVSGLVNQFVAAVDALITSKTAPNTSAASKKAPSKEQQPAERASKLEYKRVDETWNEQSGKYKIAESSGSDSNELDQYLFVVRDRIDKNTHETTSFIDIKSAFIRDALRDICQDMRSVSLADLTPSMERHVLFHVWKELESCHQRATTDPSATNAAEHLEILVDYLGSTYTPIQQHLAELLTRQEITYDLLWALFRPNTEVYSTCSGTSAPRCTLYNHCEEKQRRDGSRYLHINARYLGTDGTVLGETTVGIEIDYFRGAKRIESLSTYPLQFHPEAAEVRGQLIACGRKFASLMGIHHQQYKGKAFYIDDEGDIVRRQVKGRVMVDAIGFQENKPNYPYPRVHKVRPRYSVLGPCATIKPANLDPNRLSADELLICSPTVLGFCLTGKIFLEFAVANICDVEWNPSSFDDVRIPESQKMPILALTKTYLQRTPEDGFKDLVQGKGRGINFLLHGPPGVGKTLTAETLAESSRIPLYTVPAGQIGVEPTKVEPILKTIFKIASRWKALLLLDEADVFLAQRSENVQLNALVSVFLRELEHYDGILFLTTNRLQAFDEAVLSRVHLASRYEPLKLEARVAVWKYFVDQVRTKHGRPAFSRDVIASLAKHEINGREIRNIVFLAQSMAEYEEEVMSEKHLKASITAKQDIHLDFHGAGAVENRSSYL
ncbi:P-loop containing nucleoside triphosphate hydrolase protein [Bombardia bombarda]|uniref:P-loop containing nucleoside triphosphate hydrolase protein n=1 Tax=Bombardia bombarda TaxID=252184 RepID=A0AA39X8G6_9PEZI|nr:P-loop containing nucleoside triphosphate hydrolase protein [Bombardia bombarda]